MRRTTILLGTVVAAIGLVGLAAALWGYSARFLAQTWRDRLEVAPESQVDDILDRLAGLGDAATPALADALASSRECVAEGAARVLRRQPGCWHVLAAPEAARRHRILAKALAGTWPRYGPAARRAASEIVASLLSRSPPQGSLGDAEFLAACADVLRSGASVGVGPIPDPASSSSARRPASSSTVPQSGGDSIHPLLRSNPVSAGPDGATTSGLSSLPEGALPLEPAPMPQGISGPLEGSGPAALKASDGAAQLSAAGGKLTKNSLHELGRGESPSETQDNASAGEKLGTANEPRRLSSVRRVGFVDHGPQEGGADPDLKSAAELRQLAHWLHDADSLQVEAACKELKRCGFSDVEIELARQLTHPDAGVRRALARALPAAVGVDAAPWLLELSRDTNADVRLEAITLLATTGDPALLEQLRRLVLADPDERIQRLSDRLTNPAKLSEKKTETAGRIRK